jgi:hypothetical protein
VENVRTGGELGSENLESIPIIVIPVTRNPGPWLQCQVTNNESRVFEEEEIRFIIHQMMRRTVRVNLSKLCHPTFGGKCLLFKGEFRGSV